MTLRSYFNCKQQPWLGEAPAHEVYSLFGRPGRWYPLDGLRQLAGSAPQGKCGS